MKFNLCIEARIGDQLVYQKDHDPWCVGVCGLLHGYRYTGLGLTLNDTSNTARSWANAVGRLDAGSGNSTFGPVVGTNSSSHSWSNVNLGSRITHGTGSGQLSYGATSFNAPTTSGSDRYFEVLRTFTNLSGSAITVYEFGLVVYDGNYYYLICRDVYGSGIEIPNNQALTLTYRIKISL